MKSKREKKKEVRLENVQYCVLLSSPIWLFTLWKLQILCFAKLLDSLYAQFTCDIVFGFSVIPTGGYDARGFLFCDLGKICSMCLVFYHLMCDALGCLLVR